MDFADDDDDDEALARKLQEEEDLALVSEAIARDEEDERHRRPRQRRQPDPEPTMGSLLGSFNNLLQQQQQQQQQRQLPLSSFHRKYQAYSLLVAGVSNIASATFEHGDKILLPASALQELSGRNLLQQSGDGDADPMVFRLSVRRLDEAMSTSCCAAVLEFSAPHGCAVVPTWMLVHLGVEDGDAISVDKVVNLPRATYCKLQPVNFSDFRRLESHKAVLEETFRSYFTLTRGSTVSVLHEQAEYIFHVVDLDPADQDSALIFNADLETEFDLPEEYFEEVEPSSIGVTPQQPGVLLGEASAQQHLEGHVKCVHCERLVPESSFARHEAFCARNVWSCPDCGQRMSPSERAAHVAAVHAPVSCSSCGVLVAASLLAKHRQGECVKRRVTCAFCSLQFAADSLDGHQRDCGARTEKCPLCGAYVMLRLRQQHLDSGCVTIKQTNRRNLHLCHFCGADFDDFDELAVHLTVHDEPVVVKDDEEERFRADLASQESMSDLEASPNELSLSLSDEDNE